jgi:hypothetical protein
MAMGVADDGPAQAARIERSADYGQAGCWEYADNGIDTLHSAVPAVDNSRHKDGGK